MPGPQLSLYAFGARMREVYPLGFAELRTGAIDRGREKVTA